VAQVVEHLLCKWEALNLKPSPPKKKKKKTRIKQEVGSEGQRLKPGLSLNSW
jgi:hypothetical protein